MKKSTFFRLSVRSLLPGQVKKYPGKIKVLNFSFILLFLIFTSCQKEMENLSVSSKSDGNKLKSVVIGETPLIDAQNITTGTVTATFNAAGTQLTITYSTLNTNYCLTETHLDVEANPANFPQTNSGNPKVNQFAYGANLGCVNEWTQVINLSMVSGWSPGDTVFIAANASVKKIPGGKKEAWGQGLPFPGNNWAMYFFCQQPLPPPFYIGQSYGGGIIFYIDGTGQHGLIAAPSDQEILPWGCIGTLIGGTGTAIGTGQANTTAIVNGCSQTGIAARICDDLELNGYSDWFLPSRDELNLLNQQKLVVGGFAPQVYWSSSEYDDTQAWYQHFVWDYEDYGIDKTYTICYVRAIRAF